MASSCPREFPGLQPHRHHDPYAHPHTLFLSPFYYPPPHPPRDVDVGQIRPARPRGSRQSRVRHLAVAIPLSGHSPWPARAKALKSNRRRATRALVTCRQRQILFPPRR
ncbi:hypothetical protein MRB53_038082 [Persea americana]|nr:hypothetical protein MRB53_038082 [Persea americana]